MQLLGINSRQDQSMDKFVFLTQTQFYFILVFRKDLLWKPKDQICNFLGNILFSDRNWTEKVDQRLIDDQSFVLRIFYVESFYIKLMKLFSGIVPFVDLFIFVSIFQPHNIP